MMRETLERIDMRIVSINCIDAVQKQSIDKCRMLIKQALAAHSRNCDVGTADEQTERMSLFCKNHGVDESGCFRCEKCTFLTVERCELAWAQMPYEAQEGGAK